MILKIKLFNPLPYIDTIEIYRYAKHQHSFKHYPVKINDISIMVRRRGNGIFVTGDLSYFIKPELIKLIVKAIKVHPDIGSKV
jgi:hypothetical protein